MKLALFNWLRRHVRLSAATLLDVAVWANRAWKRTKIHPDTKTMENRLHPRILNLHHICSPGSRPYGCFLCSRTQRSVFCTSSILHSMSRTNTTSSIFPSNTAAGLLQVTPPCGTT
jgi:hypothetical protein